MRPELQRRVQRYGWNKAAAFYEDSWKEQLKPAQNKLMELAELKPGDRVLETACGTGLITCRVAEAIDPGGELTATDLSDEMVQMTGDVVSTRNLDHVMVKRMDSEQLELEDEHFDAAISCLGIMYVPNPLRSLEEKFRILKSGARVVIATWGERKNCGWADIFPIVDKRVASDVCPMFFQQGTGDALTITLGNAGFEQVETERFQVDIHYTSEELAIMAAFAGGPVALAYQKFDEKTKIEAHQEYLKSIEPFRNGHGYEIPGEFVVARAYKP